MVGGVTAKRMVTVGTHAGKQGPHLQGREADWPTAVSPSDHLQPLPSSQWEAKAEEPEITGTIWFLRDRISRSRAGLLLSV